MSADTILIGGQWQPATSGEMLSMVDPSEGREFARIARGRAEDVDRAVAAARRAF